MHLCIELHVLICIVNYIFSTMHHGLYCPVRDPWFLTAFHNALWDPFSALYKVELFSLHKQTLLPRADYMGSNEWFQTACVFPHNENAADAAQLVCLGYDKHDCTSCAASDISHLQVRCRWKNIRKNIWECFSLNDKPVKSGSLSLSLSFLNPISLAERIIKLLSYLEFIQNTEKVL